MHQQVLTMGYNSGSSMDKNDANVALKAEAGDSGVDGSAHPTAMLLFSIGMVFGPHIGYVFQIQEMYSTRNVEGYSPLVSVILLTSNSIRILYYFGHHFDLALLFQAIFAVFVHALLLMLVMHIVQVERRTAEEVPVTPQEVGLDNIIDVGDTGGTAGRSMVAWLDEQACRFEQAVLRIPPATFLRRYTIWALTVMVVVFFYYASIGAVWAEAPEVVGYIALGIEALLVLPQILRNHRRHSTEGLTLVLVLTWFIGDIIKVIYFFAYHQPLPFILCGCFQLSLDLVVIAQVIYYRCRRRRLPTVAPTTLTGPVSGEHADDQQNGK
ncbi:hypothetical protein DQ04_07691010 [Trypanosoma grayi]|uniref:hypothetical protein n=1 Tax=Trypanosoma grayi TaxID=71804 RepID=UPI0004F48129|nr:hypothetical protein DQ04_07691010 [Trypanosoma grayi]KEG08221.1 hypothetical protein DQ04_07691010 [Trypanosoma grayi]